MVLTLTYRGYEPPTPYITMFNPSSAYRFCNPYYVSIQFGNPNADTGYAVVEGFTESCIHVNAGVGLGKLKHITEDNGRNYYVIEVIPNGHDVDMHIPANCGIYSPWCKSPNNASEHFHTRC